jgi:hypothetical protein
MKKLILVFSAVALIFFSCSSDADSLPAIVPLVDSVVDVNGVLLKKEIITYNSLTNEINYTYTGNKLNRITYPHGNYEVYIYTGDLITEIRYFDVGNTLSFTEDFHYNSSNKLIGCNDLGSGVYEESYVHNSDGTISFNDSGDSGVIYFQNGEIVRITKNFSGGVSERTYTYDGMNSPFKNVIGFDKIAFTIPFVDYGIFHNLLSFHFTNTGYSTENITSTYTFNSNNFPITSTETGDRPGDVTTTQYLY